MALVVTVSFFDSGTAFFAVDDEKEVLPGVFEDFLDARLRNEIDSDQVFIVNVDDYHVTINYKNGLPKEWYIKVIDAIADCFGDEHEVLSRLSNWP